MWKPVDPTCDVTMHKWLFPTTAMCVKTVSSNETFGYINCQGKRSVDILLTFTLYKCKVMTLLNNLSGTGARSWSNPLRGEWYSFNSIFIHDNFVCHACIDLPKVTWNARVRTINFGTRTTHVQICLFRKYIYITCYPLCGILADVCLKYNVLYVNSFLVDDNI